MEHLITDPAKSVQGCALYAEFVNSSNDIYQIFFTPDGTNDNGDFVVSTVYTRRLVNGSPKRQWRIGKLRYTLRVEYVDDAEVRLKRLEPIHEVLTRLQSRYELVRKPFFVEVSKKDLNDVHAGKTPIKVVHRIGQTRMINSYPEFSK